MECCICYINNNIFKTNCNHEICYDCLNKLKSINCPLCRVELKNLPPNIDNKIKINSEEIINSDEPIIFGGGGLGPYWDAPGSNYWDLSDENKDLMDKIKTKNLTIWSKLRYEINILNKNYSSDNFKNILNDINNK